MEDALSHSGSLSLFLVAGFKQIMQGLCDKPAALN